MTIILFQFIQVIKTDYFVQWKTLDVITLSGANCKFINIKNQFVSGQTCLCQDDSLCWGQRCSDGQPRGASHLLQRRKVVERLQEQVHQVEQQRRCFFVSVLLLITRWEYPCLADYYQSIMCHQWLAYVNVRACLFASSNLQGASLSNIIAGKSFFEREV